MSTFPWNTGWLLLPHLGTDALCQQPYNQIKRHSLQWWNKQGTQNDIECVMQKVRVVCIRHWRKDTRCNISWKAFHGKEDWTSVRSQGYCCYSQIIIEGECEYFVVQDAANWNKTNVASIWRTLLLYLCQELSRIKEIISVFVISSMRDSSENQFNTKKKENV